MAGNFSPSALLNIKLKAEQMWTDAQFSADFIPQAEAARAVLSQQTATFRPLEVPDKDNVVVVNWVKTCDIDVEDCVSNCDLTEDEVDTAGKQYELDICKKTGFSVDEEKLRTNTYTLEEVSARALARSIRAMDEFWARQVLAKLKAFAGINVAPQPYTWDNVNSTTNVPAADYNRKLVAYLIKTGLLNKIRDMYFIDNGGLWVDWTNAQFDAGNLDGKGDRARIEALNMFFDMFNFGAAGLAEDTFLIGRSAVAMVTRNRHSSTPRLVGGQVNHTLYTVNSAVLPGVAYDVFYTVECKTVNGKAHYVDTWRLETQGGVFLNPEACPVTVDISGTPTEFSPTGVLSFTQV